MLDFHSGRGCHRTATHLARLDTRGPLALCETGVYTGLNKGEAMASLRDEASRLGTSAAPIDWASAVNAIVGRTPGSPSQPTDLRAQVRLLALLGSAAPLNVLLDGLATYVETWAEGLPCTVLLADPTSQQLLAGAAPSLPGNYGDAIGPVPIGEGNGCCGTAAARLKMVIVEDIERSELWTQYAPVAAAYGLRACWSVPILDDERTLLGTLALYYRERRAPSEQEIELIQFAASLAAFVIQRHRDAERVRTSEARLEAAVWGTDVGLWEATEVGHCRWFDRWSERFGVDPCIGHSSLESWFERIHRDDIDAYVAADQHCRQGTANHYAIEYRIRDRNGAWLWVHERGKVTAWASDGTPRLFAGVCIDIDAQKRTQLALRQAEDRYDLAVNASRLPVWEYDVANDTVTGNLYWHQVVGHHPSEQQARQRNETWLSDVHPDDCAAHERVITGGVTDATGFYQSEFRVRVAKNEYKWLLDRGRVIERAADGAPTKLVGICVDIDARKRVETALRESEERFRGAFEFAAIGMSLVGLDGRWMRVNRALCDIVGYSGEELLATTFQAITHPDDLGADMAYVREMLEGSRTHFTMEKRYLHKDGHVVWVLLAASLVRDDAAEPMYFVSQIQDITDRKRAEQQLLASDERASAILDAIPDLVLRLNREGVFLDYRVPQSDELFAPPEKIIGARLRDLAPVAIADQVHEHLDKALEGCATQEWEFQMDSPRGPQDYEARMVACGTDDVVAIVRNITTFSEVDRALRASLREKEVLLQEVHHRVKNNLQIVNSLINMQLRRLTEASTRETLEQCQHRVQAIALIHEQLYQSKSLADVPLADYVGRLARDILKAASVPANHVALELAIADIALPIDKAIPCGLILNELITNALKHAFPGGRQGSIRIQAEVLVDGNVQLVIADSGVGLPAGFAIKRCQSMGLQLVNTLAEQLDAQLEVYTRGGTFFQLTFPV